MLRNTRKCATVLVFVLYFSCCCCIRTSPRLVAALQRYFYTKCVFLLRNEYDGKYLNMYNMFAMFQAVPARRGNYPNFSHECCHFLGCKIRVV
jgi:hypothetical protein